MMQLQLLLRTFFYIFNKMKQKKKDHHWFIRCYKKIKYSENVNVLSIGLQ